MARVKEAFGWSHTGMWENVLSAPLWKRSTWRDEICTMCAEDDGEYSCQRGKTSESGGYWEPVALLHVLLSAILLYANTVLIPGRILRKLLFKHYLSALNPLGCCKSQPVWALLQSLSIVQWLCRQHDVSTGRTQTGLHLLVLGLILLSTKLQMSQLHHRVVGERGLCAGLWGWVRTADDETLQFFLHATALQV